MDNKILIGKRIKELRKGKKMSQARLAERIRRAQSIISRIESGEVELSPFIALAICNSFGVRKQWLLTGKGEKYDDRMNLLEDRAKELGEDIHDKYLMMRAAYDLREEQKARYESGELDLASFDVLADDDFGVIMKKVGTVILNKDKREAIKKLLDVLLPNNGESL